MPSKAYPDKEIILPNECTCTGIGSGQKMGWIYAGFYADGTAVTPKTDKGDSNEDYGLAFPCVCKEAAWEKKYRDFLFREANVPPGTWTFADYAVTRPEQQAARQAVIDWVSGKSNEPWLVLWGSVGTGKSHLAYAAALTLVGQVVQTRLEYVPALLDTLRQGYEDGTYNERLQRLREVPVLILDDLGSHRSTDWAEKQLLTLIDARYQERAPLMVTTNLGVTDLDPRLADRLQDWQRSKVVAMVWESYRQNFRA